EWPMRLAAPRLGEGSPSAVAPSLRLNPSLKKCELLPQVLGSASRQDCLCQALEARAPRRKKFEFFKANNIILTPSTSALHSLQSDRSPACRRRDCRRLRRRSPEMPAGAERRAA